MERGMHAERLAMDGRYNPFTVPGGRPAPRSVVLPTSTTKLGRSMHVSLLTSFALAALAAAVLSAAAYCLVALRIGWARIRKGKLSLSRISLSPRSRRQS